MMRQLAILWTGSLLLWLGLAIPAYFLAGDVGLLDTAIACLLCLAPMTATLLWCHWAFGGSPEQQLAAVLGGSGVRLLVAVAGGIALYHGVPALERPAFLLWVVVFYLATLTLEVVTVVRRQNALADLQSLATSRDLEPQAVQKP